MTDVDTESSQWLLEVLKASTSKAILTEIHQEYMALPKSQRGGLTLFKFIMDIVHTNTTEHVELFRSFLNTYQLRDTADEEVPGSVSGFVAVVMMLAENDRPSNLVLLLLNGLESSKQKFNDTVSAQRGALNTPMYEQFKQNETELSLLLKFVTIAKRVYYSELQAKKWKPAKTSQHLFPALSNSSKLTAEAVLAKQPKSLPPGYLNHKEKFVRWYLSRVCGICGGNHPDKHHYDPLFISPVPSTKISLPVLAHPSLKQKLLPNSSLARRRNSRGVCTKWQLIAWRISQLMMTMWWIRPMILPTWLIMMLNLLRRRIPMRILVMTVTMIHPWHWLLWRFKATVGRQVALSRPPPKPDPVPSPGLLRLQQKIHNLMWHDMSSKAAIFYVPVIICFVMWWISYQLAPTQLETSLIHMQMMGDSDDPPLGTFLGFNSLGSHTLGNYVWLYFTQWLGSCTKSFAKSLPMPWHLLVYQLPLGFLSSLVLEISMAFG
eukprot:scaffold15299_cov23-Cyclotella_meneghiniana.AAC.4